MSSQLLCIENEAYYDFELWTESLINFRGWELEEENYLYCKTVFFLNINMLDIFFPKKCFIIIFVRFN